MHALDTPLTECPNCDSHEPPAEPMTRLRILIKERNGYIQNNDGPQAFALRIKLCEEIKREHTWRKIADENFWPTTVDCERLRKRVLEKEKLLQDLFTDQYESLMASELFERYQVENQGSNLLRDMTVFRLVQPG